MMRVVDTVMTRVADAVLARAATAAGAPTGLRFTERQLYYEMCRTVVPVHLLGRRPAFVIPAAVPYGLFRDAVARRRPAGLLTACPARRAEPGEHTPEADLFDYGLPRLLVCGSHDVAEMLRANGLPMESACPVVSVDELPLAPGIVTMLEKAGDARVYVLHDAGPDGQALPARLAELTPLPSGVPVVGIGLRSAQAAPLHLAHRGGVIEVESVNPAVLLRSVHRLVREVHRRTEPLVDVRSARTAGFLTWPER